MSDIFDRIFHLNIVVSDLDRAIDFYCNKLDFTMQPNHPFEIEGEDLRIGFGLTEFDRVVCRGAFIRWGDDESRTAIDLLEFVDPSDAGPPYETLRRLGIARTAFKIKGDLDETYQLLKGRGIEFLSEPVTTVLSGVAVRWACFKDPDGTVLEIFTDQMPS